MRPSSAFWLSLLLVSAAAMAQTQETALPAGANPADTALTGDTASADTSPPRGSAIPDAGSAPAAAEPDEDARRPRKFALSAEVGMNSLASLFGALATYYALPSLAVDVGGGVSVAGLRPGMRARYLFTPGDKTSFFAGGGLKCALGTGGQEVKVKDPETKAELGFQIDPTLYADLQAGSEFLAGNGFLVIFSAGYSFLLTGDTYEFTSGTPSEKFKKAFDGALGSGIMLAVSLGLGF